MGVGALTERTYTHPARAATLVVHRPAQVVQIVAAFAVPTRHL